MVILITGGCGSLGSELVKAIDKDNTIRVFSRDELKHWKMRQTYPDVRYLLGDIRDKDRIIRATEGVDFVIHCAALKHIETGEYDPSEVIKTNIDGTSNVIEACICNNVTSACFISSDKAVNATSLYGSSKFVAEKLWMNANNNKGDKKTLFWGVRLGNLLGSSGSIIEKFRHNNIISVTDLESTRYYITLEKASKFILDNVSTQEAAIYIPKMNCVKLKDVVSSINPNAIINTIGLRRGEKMHEELYNNTEQVAEFPDYWKVI